MFFTSDTVKHYHNNTSENTHDSHLNPHKNKPDNTYTDLMHKNRHDSLSLFSNVTNSLYRNLLYYSSNWYNTTDWSRVG